MKKLIIPLFLMVGLVGAPNALANHDVDDRSPNMFHEGNFSDQGQYGQGSDTAFWGKWAIAGNFGAPGGFRILSIADKKNPKEIGQFVCPGPQADVSIWKDLVFVSVDSPRIGPECGARGATTAEVLAGQGFEGIRIVSISDPRRPEQIAFVRTDCGSHTHTLIPDLGRRSPRLLLYVSSYPLTGQHPRHEGEQECGFEPPAHQKISVVEVPLTDPASARVVNEPYVGPTTIGCHDITVFVAAKLAAAACLTESQIWDISEPVEPVILSRIRDPRINIHHSAAWSWDSNTVVIGDELGGALATPGCTGGEDTPVGALWFYDVSDPAGPVFKSHWRIPRAYPSAFCTAHNFNVVPLRTEKDILVSAWYNGGTTVVDFTNPADPKEIGYYAPKADPARQTAAWSSYWYNGLIYSNNFDQDVHGLQPSRGFDVFSIEHPDLDDEVFYLPHLNPQTQEPLPMVSGPRNQTR